MSKSASQPDKRGQLCVVFMDKKQKRNMLGFVKAENVVWEEWVIGLKLMQPRKDSGVCAAGEWAVALYVRIVTSCSVHVDCSDLWYCPATPYDIIEIWEEFCIT